MRCGHSIYFNVYQSAASLVRDIFGLVPSTPWSGDCDDGLSRRAMREHGLRYGIILPGSFLPRGECGLLSPQAGTPPREISDSTERTFSESFQQHSIARYRIQRTRCGFGCNRPQPSETHQCVAHSLRTGPQGNPIAPPTVAFIAEAYRDPARPP